MNICKNLSENLGFYFVLISLDICIWKYIIFEVQRKYLYLIYVKMRKLILVSMLSFATFGMLSMVSASNCDFDGHGYACDLWDTCQALNCRCALGPITSLETCGTICASDGFWYSCNDGDFCDSPSTCECDGSSIDSGNVCNGTNPTAPVSCTHELETFFAGQTVQRFLTWEVEFWNICTVGTVTCSDIWWIWTLWWDESYLYTSCIVLPVAAPVVATWACDLPRWGTIASGDTVTVYQNSSESCGSVCVSEIRTCNSWALDGSYTNQSCSVAGCGSSGWGGWSSTPRCDLEDVICVDGEYEKADGVYCRYGILWDICSISDTNSGDNSIIWGGDLYDFDKIWDISGSPYSAELNLAYLYAYNMWITSMDNIEDANMEWSLIRSHMAKMLVERSIAVKWLEINTEITCAFDDIDSLQWEDLYGFVIQACQMWLMWLDSEWNPVDSFYPNEIVTRAQFGTVLSRSIWGDYYNGWVPYYADHLDMLNAISVMNDISDPYMEEQRWYVMLMLLRANQILQ